MYEDTVAALRKQAHLLAVGATFTLAATGTLTGAAWFVDEHLIVHCAWGAFFMGVFFYPFFTASVDLYDKAARMRRRNTELLKLRGSDQE